MKRLYFPIILFFLTILEGVALDILPARFVISNLLIIPHWVLVFLIMMAIFYDKENTYFSILYGILFGLLIDVVYTGVLGIYMFTYAVVIYVIHGLKKMLHANIYVTILLGIIGIAMTDVTIFIIFSVVGLTTIEWVDYLQYRLLPTMIANILFLIVLYPLAKNRIIKWRDEQISASNSI